VILLWAIVAVAFVVVVVVVEWIEDGDMKTSQNANGKV